MLLANVLKPVLGPLVNELFHNLLTSFIVNDYDFVASGLQILLTVALEVDVLTYHTAWNTIHDDGTSAHVAWRQSRVQSGILVNFALQSPAILQSGDLTMQRSRPLLESHIVATSKNATVFIVD